MKPVRFLFRLESGDIRTLTQLFLENVSTHRETNSELCEIILQMTSLLIVRIGVTSAGWNAIFIAAGDEDFRSCVRPETAAGNGGNQLFGWDYFQCWSVKSRQK